MTHDHDPAADSPMRRPAKTLGQLAPHALVFAAFAAGLLSALYAIYRLMARTTDADGASSLHLADLFMKAGLLAVVLFCVALPLRLLMLHRTMQDFCFAWFGFGATFFGLAMLLVFFLRLGFEVREWFHITPGLVERHNQVLVDKVANADKEHQQLLVFLVGVGDLVDEHLVVALDQPRRDVEPLAHLEAETEEENEQHRQAEEGGPEAEPGEAEVLHRPVQHEQPQRECHTEQDDRQQPRLHEQIGEMQRRGAVGIGRARHQPVDRVQRRQQPGGERGEDQRVRRQLPQRLGGAAHRAVGGGVVVVRHWYTWR